jgi:hypothetical protein
MTPATILLITITPAAYTEFCQRAHLEHLQQISSVVVLCEANCMELAPVAHWCRTVVAQAIPLLLLFPAPTDENIRTALRFGVVDWLSMPLQH